MNTYLRIIIVTILVSISTFTNAQDKKLKKKEITFEVAGECGMCKTRIEEALDIKGIKFSEWNKETHQCKVIYDPNKISEKEIHQTIADIGHDTEMIKAKDEDYDNLHGCCHYKRIGEDNHQH